MKKDERGFGHMASQKGATCIEREVLAFHKPMAYVRYLHGRHKKMPLGALVGRIAPYVSLDDPEVSPRPTGISSNLFMYGALPALQICSKFLEGDFRQKMANDVSRFHARHITKIPEIMGETRERKLTHAAAVIIDRSTEGWDNAGKPLQDVMYRLIDRTTGRITRHMFVAHGFGFVIDLASRVHEAEVADGLWEMDQMEEKDQHYDWDAALLEIAPPPATPPEELGE